MQLFFNLFFKRQIIRKIKINYFLTFIENLFIEVCFWDKKHFGRYMASHHEDLFNLFADYLLRLFRRLAPRNDHGFYLHRFCSHPVITLLVVSLRE
jgi:hypothetical protein